MRIQSDVGTIDILGHLILWFFLILITFGIGAFFFPYSFSKFILNRSRVVDDSGRTRQVVCHTDIFGNLGHVILWILITIVTFGLGYAFYFYKVWNYSLNNSTIE